MTNVDFEQLENEVYGLFIPGSPIKIESELSGRKEQVARLRRIVISQGEHALIYGERGVGKTSISQTFHKALNSPTQKVQAILINCGDANYTEIWRKVFRRMSFEGGASLAEKYTGEITTDDVEIELSTFSLNDIPIIILDEFDKISDEETRVKITETIKSISDHAVPATLVLVGVAENASQLIKDHQSISRALKQVEMPRLSLTELEGIITSRYMTAGLKWDDEAIFLLAFLARGLPYYAHLCGRYAALAALKRRQTKVTWHSVFEGFQGALADVDQSITEKYLASTVSQRGEATLYEPVLLACALADSDQLGQFQQTSVALPLEDLTKRQKPYTAATYAFHMNEFCDEKRGSVLTREGPIRNYRYRFSDAMMQPYVIIRALNERRLDLKTLAKYTPKRQLRLV